jgi:hypothetical protein
MKEIQSSSITQGAKRGRNGKSIEDEHANSGVLQVPGADAPLDGSSFFSQVDPQGDQESAFVSIS